MDARTTRALAALDNRFYAAYAESFSRTRGSAWAGWRRCLGIVLGEASRTRLDVLDVAAGNLRFERFLAHEAPELDVTATAVDACAPLAQAQDMPPGTRFVEHDVLEALIDGKAGALGVGRTSFDLVACFGFMHHVPGKRNRARLLGALVDAARPKGIVAASFWRFLDDGRLAAKARAATERAAEEPRLAELVRGFEPGDALLGWQGERDAWRYCHGFSDAEIDELVAAVSGHTEVLARYRADGAAGRLNTYLVLRRRTADESAG